MARSEESFNDEPIDPDAVRAGAWDEPRDGRGDSLGTYREVTPAKTAAALAMLDLTQPVRTFSLGEVFFNGYPGFGRRSYAQQISIAGFDPGTGFGGEVRGREPFGPNQMSSLEERVQFSYNIGSKINGLAHSGVADVLYGGRRSAAVIADHGVTELDTTTWGPPLVTRGLVIDVLSAKLDSGHRSDITETIEGAPTLRGDYRITLEDLDDAISRQRLPSFEPGDALLVRTGWRRLIRSDPDRYLMGSPGVFLRETRWLASFRPAIVGTDSWCWGVNDRATIGGAHGACHQELLVHHGIRLGESINLDDLDRAGVDRFVFCHSPLRAEGAVSTNAPAMAIANVTA